MKNMFNKANAPYLISSTLAIATLLASGVFAAAPYVGFLAPVAALSVGLPLIIGAAVFSALVFALSAAVISRNKTISERDTQLTEKDTKISSLKGQLAKKEKVIEAKNKTIVNPNKDDELKRQHRKEKQKEILDCVDLRNLLKEEKQGEILDSEALSNLFREEGNQPKLNAVAKEVKGKAIQDVKRFRDIAIYTSTIALTLAPVISSAFIAPVSISVPTAELSDQQTPLSQANGNSTINLSPAHHVPTPQVVLENQINESSETLDNAFKSAKNNFGIPTNYSEPQWVKDLNKSETTEEIIDNGTLPNLFYENSNRDYQFAEPNITHAESSEIVGSNQTAIGKYSDPNTDLANYFMSTLGGFLKNLNPYEHFVSMVQEQVENGKTARHQGTLIDSVKLEQTSYRMTSSV